MEGWVRGQPSRLSTYKSVGSVGMHPWLLREMADVVAWLLSIIFEKSQRTREVSED